MLTKPATGSCTRTILIVERISVNNELPTGNYVLRNIQARI